MNHQTFAYYTKKKFKHRFTQGEFFQPTEFTRFLEKYGIKIQETDLEKFEKEGWIQPILRVNLTKKMQQGGLILGIEGLKSFYYAGLMEFPKKNDYVNWSEFKHDYKKGEYHDKKLFFYHSFQLLQIQNIMINKKISFIDYNSYDDLDFQRIIENIKKRREYRQKRFENDKFGKINVLGLLMLLEEPYRFHSFGSMSSNAFRKNSGFQSWIKWRQTKFSAQKLLQQSYYSIDEIKHLHSFFAREAYAINPLEKWYDLTRIMRPSVLNQLKDQALLAQFYYHICSMLSYFIYDLTKEILPEPDTIFDASDGNWKENIYSTPFDYTTRKTQRGIIRFFVREPTTRLFLLVEGETEERVIEKIFEKLQISMKDDGINVINCKGIANIEAKKLRGIIQTANQDDVSIYIIADNENKSKNKVEQIKKDVLTDFGCHIWNKSFEEDNFSIKSILKMINSMLGKNKEQISHKEILQHKKQGKSLMKSIEDAYRTKYRKDLFQTIQKSKSDISIELMTSRLKKISRNKKIGKQLEIEKVLDEAFKMIPIWG